MGSGKDGLFTPEERLNYAEAFIKVNQQPLDLDFWQQEYIRDTSKYAALNKSRQTGFSFSVALKGLIKAMDKSRFKYTRQFVSYNLDDAKEKISYAKEFYHSIPKQHRKELVSETKTSMEFYDKGGKTTSRLLSIACRQPRGKNGDLVFDEMAFYPFNQQRKIYTAGLPVISRGGCLEAGSTPFGMLGQFYDIFSNEGDKFKQFRRFTIPWWFTKEFCKDVPEAVKLAPDMDTEDRVAIFGKETIQTIFDSMFLEDFQQEYECTFIDSALSYITLDLIHANTPGMRDGDRDRPLDEGEEEKDIEIKIFKTADDLLLGYDPEIHGRLFMGYDVARFRDAAVIFVIGQLPNGLKRSVAEIEMVKKEYEYQLDQFRKIMKQVRPVRACLDSTGIGDPLREALQKEFGDAMVEGVKFNSVSKEEMAIAVKTGLEKKRYLLQNDRKFHGQIHSIRRTAVSGGAFRYDSTRDEDGHADSFWAWALADRAVIQGAAADNGNFYTKYASKKNGNVVQSGKENTESSVINTAPVLTGRRGKSITSLLRGVERANRK
ncbi:phage terminase large subunit family protein [Treponema sp. R6D11]